MMRILGLGCDLLRIERIARIGARNGRLLLDRVLAPSERRALAGRGEDASDWPGCAAAVARCIAAQEAFFKALGTGLVVPLRWADVAVGGQGGSPVLALDGAAAAAFAALGGMVCRLALSGDAAFIHATVILFGWPASAADQHRITVQRSIPGDQHA